MTKAVQPEREPGGSSTPRGLRRIAGNEREKLFVTEDVPGSSCSGDVRSGCQLKYLKGMFSVLE